MAIDFNALTHVGQRTGSGDFPTQHTSTGSNRIVFVGLNITSTSDIVTGVTYGGVSMTRATAQTGHSGVGATFLYYLVSPPNTASTISVTLSSSVDMNATAISYTGAKQTGVPDVQGNFIEYATMSTSQSVTTVSDNCFTIMYGACNGDEATVGTGSTLRFSDATTGTFLFDSGSAITPAGSYSMGANASFESNWSICMLGFAPFVPQHYTIVAETRSFALTGEPAGLFFGRRMLAETGSFALTGFASLFYKSYRLVASVGSFILTGLNATLRLGRWAPITKETTSWAPSTKETNTWTPSAKSPATWSPTTKDSSSWTPITKETTSWTNQTK